MNDLPKERHVSRRATTITALALFALWAASWALSYADLGRAAVPVAIAIACAKAALVILFFMEAATEKFSVQATVLAAFALIAVFVLLATLDVETRSPDQRDRRDLHVLR